MAWIRRGVATRWATAVMAAVAAAAAPGGDAWLTNDETALRAAREQDKPVLAVFTGSDWCSHCRALKENVLHTDAFHDWADRRVILLLIDLPREGISAEERGLRSRVCVRYGVRTFPSAVLIAADGNPVTAQTGYVGQATDAWVAPFEGHLAASTAMRSKPLGAWARDFRAVAARQGVGPAAPVTPD